MSNCGNNDCQWHKYCESGLMWHDEDITECRHWIKPKPTQEMIEKFYDEVNASDFYHNSIVLVVKAKNMDEVREQVIGTFNILYGK